MEDTKNFDSRGYPTAKGMKLIEERLAAGYDDLDNDHTSSLGRLKKLADAMCQVAPIGHDVYEMKSTAYELKSISFTDDGRFNINWGPHKAPKKKNKNKNKNNKSHAKK